MAVLRLLDTSRTGRAWRAVREDPLAAAADDDPGQPGEADGVRVRRGGRGAGRDRSSPPSRPACSPPTSTRPFLILIYAGLILGGAGSIAGAVLGGAGGRGHARRPAAQPHRGGLPLLRADPADADRQAAAVAAARRWSSGRRSRSASPLHAIVKAISRQRRGGRPAVDAAGSPTSLRDWVIVPGRHATIPPARQRRLRAADLPADRAGPAAGAAGARC